MKQFGHRPPQTKKMKVEVSATHRDGVKVALRKLSKMMEKEGRIKEMRKHEHYEKPSEKRRRKMLEKKNTIRRSVRELEKRTQIL